MWTATAWPSCFSANTALTRKASSSMALDEARSQKFLREQVCRCVRRHIQWSQVELFNNSDQVEVDFQIVGYRNRIDRFRPFHPGTQAASKSLRSRPMEKT